MRFVQQKSERLDEMEGGVCADAEPPDGSRVLRDFRPDEHDVIAWFLDRVHRRSDPVGLAEVRIVEQLEEDAADNGAGLEANLFGVGRFIPICQRDAVGRLLEELHDGGENGGEIVVVAGERRGPEDPVDLRVRAAICALAVALTTSTAMAATVTKTVNGTLLQGATPEALSGKALDPKE